ncbi:MAG: SprT family zinc-dependent metalloprotease [Rhodoferax sp.]|nr:SprT family zinc-dependent metalloprotease [Rhodoferax sp.]MDD2810510.1 SprT family zinc-dependent metalloprotease [Rhodoferax sp.]
MHPLLRFTLDLFESNQPLSLDDQAQGAINKSSRKLPKTAVVPNPDYSAPIRSALQGAQFRHPRANREMRLGHAWVAFEFKRASRRSIGFSVSAEGLAVKAPQWVLLADVDAALQAKAAWIVRKLQETRERHVRLSAQEIVWQDGATLGYLGQPIRLQLDSRQSVGAAGAELLSAEAAQSVACSGVAQVLRLALPHTATAQQIQDAAQAWLMRQAKAYFEQRLNHFAPLLGVHWKKLALSNAGKRWGSAKADGSIRLNWRLIHLQPSVIDYVVAHELSHLRVMDHSPRFWDTVRTVVPDYAALRQQLKNEASPR